MIQKQLADARAELLAECETVLTEPQKKLLEARREAASRARNEKASKPAAPATAPKDAPPEKPAGTSAN